MKRINVHEMTIKQLVERFISLSLAQDQALLMDEFSKFNRLFGEMEALKQELKKRPGDQRRALFPLYAHPNAQVRLKAAKATLAVAPRAARDVLEAIKERREFPQALDAGMTLGFLDDGTFKPT